MPSAWLAPCADLEAPEQQAACRVARVWKAWNVGSEQDAQNPELVNHTGLVYGVSASGKITTLYAANFTPAEIAHDAPLLASS